MYNNTHSRVLLCIDNAIVHDTAIPMVDITYNIINIETVGGRDPQRDRLLWSYIKYNNIID